MRQVHVVRLVTLRATFVALSLAMAALAVCSLFDFYGFGGRSPWAGNVGWTITISGQPYQVLVLAVQRSGAAERAGLRAGDRIDVRANSPLQRFQMFASGFPTTMKGVPIPLEVLRGQRRARVTLVAQSWDIGSSWFFPFSYVGVFGILLFAGLIAVRGVLSRENLMLSAILLAVAAGALGGEGFFALPWTWAYAFCALGALASPGAVALWAAYAGMFARPLSVPRRLASWLCYGLCAAAIGIALSQFIGLATLWWNPVGPLSGLSRMANVPLYAAIFAAFVSSILAIDAARGSERTRAIWTLGSLLAFFGIFAIAGEAQTLSNSYDSFTAWNIVFNANYMVVPAVMAYAALSRRLVDVGFVLNRTIVVAIVSAIVVGVFAIFEWLLGNVVVGVSHATGMLANAALALTLGLSLNPIHKRVDAFIDGLFFRKRYRDEQALLDFSKEAAYVTEAGVLLDRTVATVRAHTDARGGAILLNENHGYAATRSFGEGARMQVDENDPLILALKTWRKPLDPHRFESTISGALALPMLARGQLLGVLVLGERGSGEAYAPDDIEALAQVAHGVGTALELLATGVDGGSSVETVLALVRTLIASTEQMRSELAALHGSSTSVPRT
jgi:hypothetical protein